jgi:hypothetical protein
MTYQRKPGEPSSPRGARGAILLEAVAAVGILLAVMVVVVQTSLWGLRERARNAEHHAALELANNVMETARARPPQDLTPAWAVKQLLPKQWHDVLPGGKLTVRVEPEKTAPSARRVLVEIRWGAEPAARSLQLVGVFGPRTAIATGGKR